MNSQLKYFLFGSLFTLIVGGITILFIKIPSASNTLGANTQIPQPTLTVQKDNSSNFAKAAPQSVAKTSSPKITIEDSGGAISEAEKNQILTKIINPFIDYYRDASQGNLVTVAITLNTKPNNVSYPFQINGTFDTGAKESFLIERKGIDLLWWTPVCIGPCLLTDEFRGKYPEIIKLLQ